MMIRLSRLFVLMLLCMMFLSVGVLSYVHYQGMKRYATQTLVTELGSEAYVIKENLRSELEALTGGLRLLTGHETIIKGVNSLFYSNQVAERFESFTNRYTLVSSMYLLTRDGRVRENFGGKIRPVERNPEIKELLKGLQLAYESGALGGRVALIDDADLVPGADHRALLFISSVTSVVVRQGDALQGFLVAVVPLANLLQRVELAPNTKGSLAQIGLSLPPEPYGMISQSEKLAVGERDYSPNINLQIRVSRSAENMGAAVTDAIHPFLNYQLAISGILIFIFALFARPILRAFNMLYKTIQQMESGKPVVRGNSRIWEFSHTERLLMEMQSRINEQHSALAKNNAELAALAQDKDRYLQELSELNLSLEEKVQERTNTLASTLQRIEVTNKIYNQLIQLRQSLALDSDDDEVLQTVVKYLHACQLAHPFALMLQIPGSAPCFYYHPDYQGQVEVPHHGKAIDYYFTEQEYAIPFPPPFGGGWIFVQTSKLNEETLKGLLLFAREVGNCLENRALTSRLAFWARTDGLTGLGNRVAFEQELATIETALDAELGLFLIDVNGLKELNDTRGHEAGDGLLRAVAQRLRQCVDSSVGRLYRVGGDEFVILLRDDELGSRDELKDKLAQAQSNAASLSGREYAISFSVGYAESSTTPFPLLYKAADKAMYQQKQLYYERKRLEDKGLEQ